MIEIQTKPGYLYLLKNNLLGGYKIGITTSPESRFKALSVGDKTELVGYWKTDGYRELERYFHKLYSNVRVPQSEWFNLDDETVETFVEQMHSSSVTQYLKPQMQPAFVGPQFRFIERPPYKQSGINGFVIAAIAASVAYLLGAVFN